jgi:hypothetical protein
MALALTATVKTAPKRGADNAYLNMKICEGGQLEGIRNLNVSRRRINRSFLTLQTR